MLAAYLSQFSALADNNINCGPVLTWMEVARRAPHSCPGSWDSWLPVIHPVSNTHDSLSISLSEYVDNVFPPGPDRQQGEPPAGV